MDKRNDYNSILKQQAKERAKNYMRLKDGYIEPKDVVLGDKTSLDAQMLDKLEPKQETLEGAANKSAIEQYEAGNSDYILGFKEGANWQAERMYSEEDIIEFAEFVTRYPDKNKNHIGQMLHAKSRYDVAERTLDLLQSWFEQFKKEKL